MIRSEKAVSEVLGMIILLSIVMLVIGSILLVGVPLIESARNTAKMDVAMSSFLSLQNDIEEVVRGPIWVKNPKTTDARGLGPSRETEFELMGGGLMVSPNRTNVTCSPGCNSLNVSNFTVTIPDGKILYTTNEGVIVYENGAVIRKYETGYPLMVSYPLVSIYGTGDANMTVSIHVISINGTISSTGGDSRAWVETRPVYYNQSIESQSFPNVNNTIIKITSSYPEAWKAFFEGKLRGAGLEHTNKWNTTGYNFSEDKGLLEVHIYGKKPGIEPDIFLSVYESKLDIRVR